MDDGWGTNSRRRKSSGHDTDPEDTSYDPEFDMSVDAISSANSNSGRQRQSTAADTLKTNDQEKWLHEINRLKTFENHWQGDFFVSAEELAKNGFIYIGPNDRVLCVFCQKKLWSWVSGDSVEEEHRKHYPRCPFVQGQCHDSNVPIDSSEIMGIHMHTETDHDSPALADCFHRRRTFQNWPQNAPLQPDRLAEAGFFYSGKGDKVQCFSCGIFLGGWQLSDDPWYTHAKMSPDCSHVVSVKGIKYVQIVSDCEKKNGSVTPGSNSLQNGFMRGDLQNKAKSNGDMPESLRSLEDKTAQLTLEHCSRIDADLGSALVRAVMDVHDLSLEQTRKLLGRIRTVKGPDYKITSKDFSDLVDVYKNVA